MDKAGTGQAVPADIGSRTLRIAANDKGAEASSTDSARAAASQTEFLARRQATVLEILADFSDQQTLTAALLSVANDLQHRFQCDRVAVGLNVDKYIKVSAISQQAVLEARSDEVRLLGAAMQEACDQECLIDFSGSSESLTTTKSHQALSLGLEISHICTIPLCDNERVIGALLLQRRAEQSWSRLTIELLTQIASLIAPLIVLRCDAERSIVSTLNSRLRIQLEKLFEPRLLIVKGTAALFVLLLVFACFVPVTHYVKASAEIVPTERRAISAPTNGLVSSVFVKAGDHVRTGDKLIDLDTRELELIQAGQENEVRAARAELRSAMASYDRKEIAIAQALLDQKVAELALTKQQILRTSMTAPIDGVIVSGDLSQSLGMSVDRGKVLLELAPVDGYEVHLLVHEVDMPYVRVGQTGRLSLEADPGQPLAIEVTAIHPIARADSGVNRFLIETTPVDPIAGLRPGQTGMAKLAAGKASLLWVWTHRFLDWGRQRLWEWIG
ncbi:MAG: HlyD family efflux transporter periplasmic adaptor subunit [Granulosicoccus sp.]|nr:HlyD family efflux transporter periplasmic adaptor subunit [Granulosicoccus sp.]